MTILPSPRRDLLADSLSSDYKLEIAVSQSPVGFPRLDLPGVLKFYEPLNSKCMQTANRSRSQKFHKGSLQTHLAPMPQPLRLLPLCWRPSCRFVLGIGRETTRDSLLMKEWLEADRGMRERCQSCVLPSPYLRHRAPGFETWSPRLVCLVMPWIESCNRHRENAFADCVPSR